MNRLIGCLLLSVISLIGVYSLPQSRIIGGFLAPDNRHLVRVESSNASHTKTGSGSFITLNCLLTSASQIHLYDKFKLEYKTHAIIAYGKTAHPDYNPITRQHDIGIIRSTTFHEYVENVIALPAAFSTTPLENEQGLVSGYGLTSTDSLTWTTHLTPQSAYQRVINDATCKTMLGTNKNFVTSSHFCAFDDEDDARVCIGDEGAGLSLDIKRVPTIVGVLSRVVNLCHSDQPAIYTRVSPYVEWIKVVVGLS